MTRKVTLWGFEWIPITDEHRAQIPPRARPVMDKAEIFETSVVPDNRLVFGIFPDYMDPEENVPDIIIDQPLSGDGICYVGMRGRDGEFEVVQSFQFAQKGTLH